MRFVNLTGGPLRVTPGPSGPLAEVAPSGQVASVELVVEKVGELDCPAGGQLALYRQHPAGEPKNLPPPSPGTVYIVDETVARAALAAGRLDVFAPRTLTRDAANGGVVADGLLEPW